MVIEIWSTSTTTRNRNWNNFHHFEDLPQFTRAELDRDGLYRRHRRTGKSRAAIGELDDQFEDVFVVRYECDYMHYAPDAESGLEGIKTYCQNLRCINIHGRRRLNLSISNLLASYGERLQQCHVEDMNEIELKAITSACKNARFTAMVLCGSELYSTLEVLGSQLDKIYVDNREGSLDFRDCTNAWNGCVNLREIQVMNCCGKIAREIIATPKERA